MRRLFFNQLLKYLLENQDVLEGTDLCVWIRNPFTKRVEKMANVEGIEYDKRFHRIVFDIFDPNQRA